MSKGVQAASGEMILVAERARIADPTKQAQITSGKAQVQLAGSHFVTMTNVLAPVAQDAQCRLYIILF